MITEIQNKLFNCIINNCANEISFESIDNETDIIEMLAYDSLAIMGLILDIETEFLIEFDEEDIDFSLLKSLEALEKLVKLKLQV